MPHARRPSPVVVELGGGRCRCCTVGRASIVSCQHCVFVVEGQDFCLDPAGRASLPLAHTHAVSPALAREGGRCRGVDDENLGCVLCWAPNGAATSIDATTTSVDAATSSWDKRGRSTPPTAAMHRTSKPVGRRPVILPALVSLIKYTQLKRRFKIEQGWCAAHDRGLSTAILRLCPRLPLRQ